MKDVHLNRRNKELPQLTGCLSHFVLTKVWSVNLMIGSRSTPFISMLREHTQYTKDTATECHMNICVCFTLTASSNLSFDSSHFCFSAPALISLLFHLTGD